MTLLCYLLIVFINILFIQACVAIPVEIYHKKSKGNRFISLFQEDIFLRNKTVLFRNAFPDKEHRWPNGIVYYVVDDTYSEEDKEVIKTAMEEFESKTCISWVERTDEEDYVLISNDAGCWSDLGRAGEQQTLSLELPDCMKKGIIMHEMMHTLGFMHEISRPDRDDYVRINWSNIIPGKEYNFEKLPPWMINTLGLDYDYKSVMHYPAWIYANDQSLPTIWPTRTHPHVELKDLGFGEVSGEFTDLDIQKIKTFYECEDK